MSGDADLAAVAAVLADGGRARMLLALDDGRALPASMLAAEAGVAPSTATFHLARLLDAGSPRRRRSCARRRLPAMPTSIAPELFVRRGSAAVEFYAAAFGAVV